jgi:hypothetical protein
VAIHYQREDASKRAVIVVSGELDPDEAMAMLQKHRADGAWGYDVLYDIRQMSWTPDTQTMREFAQATAPRPGEPARGRVAIVVSDPEMYRKACTYALMARRNMAIEVFSRMDEAEAWLRG